jgi:hypothetical protein
VRRPIEVGDERAPRPAHFYRRSLTLRSGETEFVVYAVLPTRGKPDPVPVLAGFPVGWRPTPNAGECLADATSRERYFLTSVPRSQFKHYVKISEPEALALYPDLLR